MNMKILVTGGTGVIGGSAVRELHGAGHEVRVLARHAERDRTWWPDRVDAWNGDVANEKSIRGAGEGCDVAIHIAGIIEEEPPSSTFQSVNIEGTRYVALEAERAGIRKLIYVSSLGAQRGRSAYHRSKLVAEEVVEAFSRDWLVLRPGAVYGPGDEHLSVLLRMVQTLPVVPTIGGGDQQFQPIWHEDFARALRVSAERDDMRGRRLDVAGTEATSQNDVIARLRRITGRDAVAAAPIPDFVAQWGVRALDAVGVKLPLSEAQLEMLVEGNVIPSGCPNGLTDVLGLEATPLDEGLRKLVEVQPTQLPSEGVGTLTMKRYWVDIARSRYDAEALLEQIRLRLPELMPEPLAMRPASRAASVDAGDTLVIDLPMRGQCQVRIAEVSNRSITLLTVAGHPLAGAVRLAVEPKSESANLLCFEIQVFDRAGSVVDQMLMRLGGEWLQRASWVELADNVAKLSGGSSSGVETDSTTLEGADARRVETWAAALAAQLSRNSASGGRS